ncbi:hypothetical protein [Nonomuraea sp. NPDC049400]|uniref:hypothetical protein n=1 Tax=Nonomuraea sp. NPDC049400 TaxID=3364352 RepID=UPI0037941668
MSDNVQPGTWTDDAARSIAGEIGRLLQALITDDNEAFDAAAAKARRLMDDPASKHK